MIKMEGIDVSFSYDRDSGLTVAFIEKDGEEYLGTALCSINDIFNKNTGRKVALANALKTTDFDRALRTKIWGAYFGLRHGKKE